MTYLIENVFVNIMSDIIASVSSKLNKHTRKIS